jgi:hypothetical protein
LQKAVFISTLLLGAQGCFGSLILQSATQSTGTGLGTEPTILTIQASSSGTTETGCVGYNSNQVGTFFTAAGACNITATNDVKTGAGQIGPQTLSSASLTSASNLAIVLNATQTSAGPITLTGLQMSIFNPTTGAVLFTTDAFSCVAAGLGSAPGQCTFPTTATGIGKSGYVFALDSKEAAAAAAAFASGGNVVGLSASFSNTNGGPETFYLGNLSGTAPGPTPTPEPGTWFLTFAGLGLVSTRFIRKAARS